MDLYNQTPFATDRALFLDGTGLERLLVVVKGTFSLARATLEPAEEQVPVVLADEYRADPAHSSLYASSDMAPTKPATDVLLNGCAYTTPSSPTEAMVAFRVGALSKGIRVVGDRVWEGALSSSPSAPRPFTNMELTWEKAFGGTDESHPEKPQRCDQNPAGRGFRGSGSSLPVAGTPLPNLEDPRDPIRAPSDRPRPAGFGPIAPWWHPRSEHVGTYDDAWMRERMPFLPPDFDERFFLSAPRDQIYPGYIQGGEPVRVVGATPGGPLEFKLPVIRPEIVLRFDRERVILPCRCDTVLLECEQKQVVLVWRGSHSIHGRVSALQSIKLQLEKATDGR